MTMQSFKSEIDKTCGGAPMAVCVHHWDAFTHRPGKGNPAGIVLSAQGLDDGDMQSIARVIGFNDTAFVLPSQNADFRIRYFAPGHEVELCGHATIAAFAALHRQRLLRDNSSGNYTLETKAGILPIGIEASAGSDPLVIMTQGLSQFSKFNEAPTKLAKALGITVADFHATLPIVYGSTGRWTLVVPVRNLDAMQRMCPSLAEFAAALSDMPGASIHPFCVETIDSRANLHARHFSSPTSGTLEDAVTGTASGVLGAYYRRFITNRDDIEQPLVIEQGYEIGREGTVQVWATKVEDNYAVRIAGRACFVRHIEVNRPWLHTPASPSE
jgi:PhzF family phenazine biosynthesis protein